jgi:hypothetical protein
MTYTYTTQKALRAAFWDRFPSLTRRRIKDYTGTGLMHCTDTRCAWVDWIDYLEKDRQISTELAQRATLD